MDVGAPSVAPSAHATRAGAYGEGDVVADGTHAAGGVAAAAWLAATLGGGCVNAGGRPQTSESVSRRDPPILSILILHSLMDLVAAAQLSFPVV